MTTPSASLRRARTYVQVARGDSLVRNSLYMMSATVATAVLGYIFWIAAARVFSTAQVGIASAVISLCSTVALLAYLGPAAMLVERLHTYDQPRAWNSFIVRTCAATAAVTAVLAAVTIPLIAHTKGYGSYFGAAGAAVLAVTGASVWTVVQMYCSAFIAARRADGMFAVQGLISLFKVLLVVPLCAAGLGAPGIVIAWVASSVIGAAAGAFWLLPRIEPGSAPAVPAGAAGTQRGRRARHERPPRKRADYVSHLVGQHLTSVGGQMTPLLLPVLVVARLGAGSNAYFYITWMIGSVFFMVSPSISQALFAESVRNDISLRPTVVKAFRIAAFLLIPAMLAMVAGGKLILAIFGQAYVSAGYGLLVLLAISAMPDAVSNVAVAICRATNRLSYSASINLGILAFTVVSAWLLMPRFGLLGVGIGWLAAQVLSALACIPAFLNLDGRTAA
jgi:O-antigen/teichoic acid export membrane protein